VDTHNFFFTRATMLNARAEYGLGFLACAWLMLANWGELDLWLAIALFAYMDVIGTIPSLVAFHRSPDGQIPRVYYVLYNVLHSAVTQGLVIIVLIQLFGWQWALLAIPLHICADRSMFNNYPKPFGVAFDPVRHPAFQRFAAEYERFDASAVDWKAVRRGETAAAPETASSTA
jgi:hypothetical protein